MVKTTVHKFYSKKEIPDEMLEELKEYEWIIYEDKKEGILVDNINPYDSFNVEKGKHFEIHEVEHIPEKDDDEDELFYNENDIEVEYGERRLFVIDPFPYNRFEEDPILMK
jgi:hypothetical protein